MKAQEIIEKPADEHDGCCKTIAKDEMEKLKAELVTYDE